ncbi:uracil-DNA glycosylase [Neisseriaceae bacterium JH1-16]|nr:uracil-DNA glycosylase [Neisseriaceae bacterium JH1-16]
MSLDYLSPALKRVHPDWETVLRQPGCARTLASIDAALTAAMHDGKTVYPPRELIFNALSFGSPADVRVVILGQDPYHGDGEAMGLSFSVPDGVRVPPSLRNVYKELAADLGVGPANSGDLSGWARQGVLLLNSVLSVEADRAGSHGKLGWQTVSDALIDAVNRDNPGCVFLLWGNWAQGKAERIDTSRHTVFCSAHPSPLAAHRGFFGNHHFSQANAWLAARGRGTIDWAPAAQPGLFG